MRPRSPSAALVVFHSVLRQGFTRRVLKTAALGLWLLPYAARAMERITLRNGFAYDCSRQEPLDGTHVRLYLLPSQPGTAANYIDLPASSVADVEVLPDPPQASGKPATEGLPVSSVRNPDLHTILAAAGAAHDIDVELLASIIHAESGGRTGAVSRVGAVGLMQLMPATALSLGVLNPRLPDQNIYGGTAYLDALLNRYRNNLALALAAYNAGPGAVDRYGGVPPFRETRAYVARVMTEFKHRKLEYARQEHSR